MNEISHYVWCMDCCCSVGMWASYRWHVDRGHVLLWSVKAGGRRARRHADNPGQLTVVKPSGSL